MNPSLAAGLVFELLGALGEPSPVITPPPGRVGTAPALFVAYEWRSDRFDYHFERPSRFDTPTDVPHFYEQSYQVSQPWILLLARYRVARTLWESEVGLTREGSGPATDADTFFNPGGNVVVYANEVDAAIQAFRLRQRCGLFEAGPWDGFVEYAYSRHRSRYPPGQTTISQTNPPSSTSFWNTGRETTLSEVHEISFGAGRRFAVLPDVVLRVEATVVPLTVGRLTTQLPDKYPGREIVDTATGLTLLPALALSARRGRFALEASVEILHTWGYSRSNRLRRDGLGLTLRVGIGPRRP